MLVEPVEVKLEKLLSMLLTQHESALGLDFKTYVRLKIKKGN